MAETVVHNPKKHRFEIRVDDVLAGTTHYRESNGVATFDHTEVNPEFRVRGLATRLVRGTLDQIRAAGEWKVRAVCTFVQGFVQRNPEYEDLLVE